MIECDSPKSFLRSFNPAPANCPSVFRVCRFLISPFLGLCVLSAAVYFLPCPQRRKQNLRTVFQGKRKSTPAASEFWTRLESKHLVLSLGNCDTNCCCLRQCFKQFCSQTPTIYSDNKMNRFCFRCPLFPRKLSNLEYVVLICVTFRNHHGFSW